MPGFSEKNQNDPIITEGGVEFFKNPKFIDFHKFQVKIKNFCSICLVSLLKNLE